MYRLFLAAVVLFAVSSAGAAAEPVGKTIAVKDVDDFTHKSDVLRYNNLSIKEGSDSKGYADIDLSLSVKNLTKDKRAKTKVMVIGMKEDGSPLWVATLTPKGFDGTISPETTDTLTGWATVPKGTLKETSKIWIRIVERDE